MSIEALLQAQIDALKENTAAVMLLEASLVGRASGKTKAELSKEEKPVLSKGDKIVAKGDGLTDDTHAMKGGAMVSQAAIEEVAAVQEQLAAEREARGATSYETLRELVLKLASGGKRAEIQAVNKAHGIGNAKELLSNTEDFTSVKDQAKLEAYYSDLLALEA